MKPEQTSAGHLRDMLRQVEEIDREAERLAGELTEAQLGWVPREGGWSVGQVLEHLVLGGTVYNEHLRPLVEGAPKSRAPWRPSPMGRLLVWSLRPAQRRKLKAPKIISPGPDPRSGVLAAFLECQSELAGLMRRCEGVDLRAKTRSPVNRLIPLNLGDCFAVLVVHARRHLEQIARIRGAEGFPAAGHPASLSTRSTSNR